MKQLAVKNLIFLLLGLTFLFFSEVNAMELTSSAFNHNELIPSRYTCDGANISPALKWNNIPKEIKSLALICDDPDAPKGTWTHWVLYNLPVTVNELAEGIKILPEGSVAGINSWGEHNYGGPCPPSGVHRYFFTLYALDEVLEVSAAIDSEKLQKMIAGHVVAKAVLLGRYKRK